ncbi:MAG: acetate/propionate family kinase [Acidobacteriaceae bacterium]
MRLGGGVHILVINRGSSSIKFSIFEADPDTGPAGRFSWPRVLFAGEISGVGGPGLGFTFRDAEGRELSKGAPQANDASKKDPMTLLENTVCGTGMPAIDAVGYRVVHPGPLLHQHQRITEEVLRDLQAAVAFAPLHDPQAIALIRDMMGRFPQARHYACFDTIFHQTMPAEASTYPIPSEYRRQGVRRYGFHGLSCEGVVDDMRAAALEARAEFPRRMVIAHLGSGCSVTALVDGRSVDNTMGLTPTGGVVMGTRPGDLDPGLVLYLLRQAKGESEAAWAKVESMLNHQAGMVALSGLPNDMRAVRKAAAQGNADAKLAIEVFCRSVRKAIGAYVWLLAGLDALVFTGGIGEHDVQSRAEILQGLESCGVVLDATANAAGGDALRRVSAPDSKLAVWVVTAQEDRMIAVHVRQMERN